MKKPDFIKAALPLMLAAGMLASCGKRTVMIDDELPKLTMAQAVVTEPAFAPEEDAESKAEDTKPDMNDPNTEPHLRWGVWFAYNENESSYYFFENDNTTGTKVSVRNGVSTPFRYEQDEEGYVFHFDTEDNNTRATIEYPDFDHAVITLPDGVVEELEYISPQIFAEFMFYTDEELERMARMVFANLENDPKRVQLANIKAHTLRSSECIVQIYMSVKDPETREEKISVVDNYTVDRITGSGTRADGSYVDLSR